MLCAGIFQCGWCGHSWVVSGTAKSTWNVDDWSGLCCITLILEHSFGLVDEVM